ncbi:hypothetical protein F4804DRAFT_352612 [Jackrogersella minutella]|nr:hypothetical protein F4804DRAFT_352612 [Jackrogersella minutella]
MRSKKEKSPRSGKYLKLLCRFYEPLILLEALGPTRGTHTSALLNAPNAQCERRRLLDNLSYLCDYDKGGDTTSAIGLEENDRCFVFWVASNADTASNKIVGFLNSSLEEIHSVNHEEDNIDDFENNFIRKCIKFAESRVKKEIRLLSRAVEIGKKRFGNSKLVEDSKLITWLSQFTSSSHRSGVDICIHAYNQRKAPEMNWLKKKTETNKEDENLTKIRHYFGRLVHHVRASKEVIEDAIALSNLLDVYEVRKVGLVPSNQRPQADSLKELHSILGRMLHGTDPNVVQYRESLTDLDQKFNITQRVRQSYGNKNFKPRVHAEIQVLEHFWESKYKFAGNDRYIGCSKPACYCCHLYFQFHISRPVIPPSHLKIYLNWGVRDLPEGDMDPGYIAQRDLLNKMVVTIRQDALDQIEKKAGPSRWHPDSLTGITESVVVLKSSTTRHPRGSSFERNMSILDIESIPFEATPSMESQSPPSEELSDSSSEDFMSPTSELGDSDPGSDSDSDGGAAC